MTAYIKRISDGEILHSCSAQTVVNPAHLASCQDFITSRGMSLNDYEIADGTESEVMVLIASAVTPMETWKNGMRDTDKGMPRYLEDLITTNSLTMTSEMKVRYDAKIKLRGERP